MNRVVASAFALSLVAILIGTTSSAQVRTIEVSKLGPQVGQTVPAFSLPDQHGTTWTLRSVMGARGAMIVFYRSADWCPYCKTQLLELQSQLDALKQQGLGLAAISYDSRDILAAFSEQHGITFPLLSDAGSATIKRYGILNTAALDAVGPNSSDPGVAARARVYVSGNGATAAMVGIPFPGTFIVDRSGRVTSRFFEDSYTVRNTVSNILLKTKGASAPVAAERIATQHVDVTTYASDAAVAPGNRFSVVVSVAPHAHMHVYAPGASGYKVVGLTVAGNKYIRALPVKYPASEIYEFKPLNEKVPAYQKPFTVVQELLLDGSAATRAALGNQKSLAITGSFEYQACDDGICYNPTSVPLTWTVGLKPIVTQPTNRPANR